MRKKILSAILSVCMVLTLMPTVAFAQDSGTLAGGPVIGELQFFADGAKANDVVGKDDSERATMIVPYSGLANGTKYALTLTYPDGVDHTMSKDAITVDDTEEELIALPDGTKAEGKYYFTLNAWEGSKNPEYLGLGAGQYTVKLYTVAGQSGSETYTKITEKKITLAEVTVDFGTGKDANDCITKHEDKGDDKFFTVDENDANKAKFFVNAADITNVTNAETTLSKLITVKDLTGGTWAYDSTSKTFAYTISPKIAKAGFAWDYEEANTKYTADLNEVRGNNDANVKDCMNQTMWMVLSGLDTSKYYYFEIKDSEGSIAFKDVFQPAKTNPGYSMSFLHTGENAQNSLNAVAKAGTYTVTVWENANATPPNTSPAANTALDTANITVTTAEPINVTKVEPAGTTGLKITLDKKLAGRYYIDVADITTAGSSTSVGHFVTDAVMSETPTFTFNSGDTLTLDSSKSLEVGHTYAVKIYQAKTDDVKVGEALNTQNDKKNEYTVPKDTEIIVTVDNTGEITLAPATAAQGNTFNYSVISTTEKTAIEELVKDGLTNIKDADVNSKLGTSNQLKAEKPVLTFADTGKFVLVTEIGAEGAVVKYGISDAINIPEQKTAAPVFNPATVTMASDTAKTVDLTLTEPAAAATTKYKVYASDTATEVVNGVTAALKEGTDPANKIVTLTFTNAPAADTTYYISAKDADPKTESTRTAVNVKAYVSPTIVKAALLDVEDNAILSVPVTVEPDKTDKKKGTITIDGTIPAFEAASVTYKVQYTTSDESVGDPISPASITINKAGDVLSLAGTPTITVGNIVYTVKLADTFKTSIVKAASEDPVAAIPETLGTLNTTETSTLKTGLTDGSTTADFTTAATEISKLVEDTETRKDALLAEASADSSGNTYTKLEVVTYLAISVDENAYNDGSAAGETKTLTVKIEPMYKIVATNDAGDKRSGALGDGAQPLPNKENKAMEVTVKVAITGFFTVSQTSTTVKHYNTDASGEQLNTVKEWLPATVDQANNKVTFTPSGFSPFEILATDMAVSVTYTGISGDPVPLTPSSIGSATIPTGTAQANKIFSGWAFTENGTAEVKPGTLDQKTFDLLVTKATAGAVTLYPIYKDNTVRPPSSGGGGGSSAPTYAVSAPSSVDNGKITVSPKNASKGNTVTITATPDEGYKVGTITVKDKDGKEIEVKDAGDGKYTFVMPASKVDITADFVKDDGTTEPTDPTNPTDPTTVTYSDVAATAWYYDAVNYVTTNGLMNGVGNDRFAPNSNLTRAMFAQILYNKEGKPAAGASTFSDVATGQWYTDAISWAAANGVVNGIGNNIFGPNNNITREQLAVMLYRYAGSPAVSGSVTGFNDAGQISSYATTAMAWATTNGVMNGKGDGRLDPKGLATRAEVAQMMQNYFK